MAKSHVVMIDEPFTFVQSIGALVLDGKEIAPAKDVTITYTEGQLCTFTTKKDAEKFIKHHATNGHKLHYVGKQ